jgi:uncharacterized membrane protein YphA (DoxX/SURF4 family)
MPSTGVRGAGGGGAQSRGLAILRILLGVFFLAEGLAKLGWLLDSGPLMERLQGWLSGATPMSRWYLHTVAIPGAPLFARMVMLGQVSAGIALTIGFWTRLAATFAFLMVLNFHIASGAIFHWSFLNNGYGLPVLGGLLALSIGGGRLPWGVKN